MPSQIYWVKRDVGLFRKPKWVVLLGPLKFGEYPDRDTAVAAAIAEAERTSILGRTTEVWVNDGAGFIFEKSFQAQKGKDKKGGKEEEDLTGEEDIVFTVDEPATDPNAY
ncbi:MAG: hypothetical protein ACR2F8_03355 [Caulobacteraceae bacterium]